MLNCAKCGRHSCNKNDLEKIPPDCPMESFGKIYEEAAAVYRESAGGMACVSARVEAAGYGVWPRIREIMEFSRLSGFNKLGLAFCVGLRREAREVNRILTSNGFEVASVICKTGSKPKEELGLRDDEKVRPGRFEAMCNPVAQALLLNEGKTDLNILLGLCVGHDTIFIQHSKAPVTVLAVKDRVTGHNPLAAVYAGHYFKSKIDLS